VVVFGLPPLAHENDPARATVATLKVHELLGKLGLKSSIGVRCACSLLVDSIGADEIMLMNH